MKMQGPYWVYTHTCPNGMVYVGMSSRKDTCDRWGKNRYRTSSLEPYIEEFGWENIEHFFIDGIQTKESAMKLEGDLIQMYRDMGCCINRNNSGSWSLDKEELKEYHKRYREENKEYQKEYQKKYREGHKEYFKQYQKQYNKQYQEEHKEKIKEYQKQYQKQCYQKKKLLKQITPDGCIQLF